jgi:hypothetical protein
MLYPGLFLIMDSTERLNTMAFRCARGTNKSVRLQSIGHDLADHRGAIRTIREIHKEAPTISIGRCAITVRFTKITT